MTDIAYVNMSSFFKFFCFLNYTYTHLHAGNCRGGEKQAYLLQGGKEWRKKVKKEKEKEKPGVILASKKKSGDRK